MRADYCQRIYRNGLNGNRTCGASNRFNPIPVLSLSKYWNPLTVLGDSAPSHLGAKPGIAHFIEAQMDQVQGEKEAHEGKDRG